MKNPFHFSEDKPKKTVKVPLPRSSHGISLSKSESPGVRDNTSDSSESKKTRIGRQSLMSTLGKGEGENIVCPKCQYPLRVKPIPSSPCPNCGYYDISQLQNTASDSRRTMPLSELNLQGKNVKSEFRFKVISESSNTEYIIESTDDEVVLNRNHLDPENDTISSQKHLLVKFREGRIYIQDVSTNGSTFFQVLKREQVSVGSRIVIGNRMFLLANVKGGNPEPNQATRNLSNIGYDQDIKNDYALIDERNGRRIYLKHGDNILKRSLLDPGNLSISESQHANLEFIDGNWFVIDKSSNAATFIQCSTEHLMTSRERLIIGNMIYRFEYY
jgi:ssDNA-binding Zn-finger/Zn-ribbon topoisomerase 1